MACMTWPYKLRVFNEDGEKGFCQRTTENWSCESAMWVFLGGQANKKPVSKEDFIQVSNPLEVVHGDLSWPIKLATMEGNQYVFTMIDDYSWYIWTYLLKGKGDAFSHFKKFTALVEKEIDKPLKCFRSDRGGEFTLHEFNTFCEEKGIKQYLTTPYTPQQHDVVERRNRTLMEMTRSMLKVMNVPNSLSRKVVNHSTCIINRLYTWVLVDQTPYENLKGKKPNLKYLWIFGCLAYARVEPTNIKNLDARSRTLVYLGKEQGLKAYWLFNPTNHRILISQDVNFDETKGWICNRLTYSEIEVPGSFTIPWKSQVGEAISVEDVIIQYKIDSSQTINQARDICLSNDGRSTISKTICASKMIPKWLGTIRASKTNTKWPHITCWWRLWGTPLSNSRRTNNFEEAKVQLEWVKAWIQKLIQ